MRTVCSQIALGFALWAGITSDIALAGSAATSSPAGSFDTDLAASRVYCKVGSAGRLGHEHGVIGRLSAGTISLRNNGLGELTFDMTTFVVDAPEARRYVGLSGTVSSSDQQKTNANMKGPHILDVARFPTATFAYNAAAALDGQAPGEVGRYRLEGQFTLHGVTRPLVLEAIVERTGTPGSLRMRCRFPILQSQFGITPYSALGGLVSVADRLEIWGDLVIRTASR